MTADEFRAWQEAQPDTYELLHGVLVRVSDYKRGGRRLGNLFRAANLTFGQWQSVEWPPDRSGLRSQCASWRPQAPTIR